MECLLMGGAPTVGKSESIHRLALFLQGIGYNDYLNLVPVKFKDFQAILRGRDPNGREVSIIINTATDTPPIIQSFKAFFDKHGGNYDILISSIRDDDFYPRKDFFKIMGINSKGGNILEVPLAKITRRDNNFKIALKWYYDKIDNLNQQIIRKTPFNL